MMLFSNLTLCELHETRDRVSPLTKRYAEPSPVSDPQTALTREASVEMSEASVQHGVWVSDWGA